MNITTAQPNDGPPFVEKLTDVARDIQYYAEGELPWNPPVYDTTQ
jgi:hypothetical protein